MLSAQTISIIKSTVPVLEVHGQAITTRFYDMLFQNHPELLHIFNHVNQRQGRQQAALANAVYAAAQHIDQLENIMPVVKQIAHKHRSLGVLPEHYPIVGSHLLLAIKEVLGDACTDEILQAWTEAYGIIADAFIAVEEQMYVEAEQQSGGFRHFKPFTVINKVVESSVITSFYLQPLDGSSIPPFTAGQYISIKAAIPGEQYEQIRQYSVSNISGEPYLRISVKREDGGNYPAGKVSNYLHQQVQIGDVLPISAPAGDFVLQSNNKPLVLISGGVGQTPLYSMLSTALAEQVKRPITYVHAAINKEAHAFVEQLKQLQTEHNQLQAYVCYEQPTENDTLHVDYNKAGYIDLPWLRSIIPTDADFYICGPLPFMKAVYHMLTELGIDAKQINYEMFGPALDISTPALSV
ncbi:NO-inducible flavohemoprotein [Paenibacillus yanchengensis]|uniref:Flavohemoprotein n=1 Tax=Paenibacillus yanchengensis TaxID=2035833 RepID=A0ABW4YLG1_9BACL